jgi:hypothetical protein
MSLIRPQKPLILVAFISSLILFSTAGKAALDTKGPPSEQTPDKQLSYTFAEVRIEFPSSLWELVAESEMDISFVRRYTIGFSNTFGILLVDVYPMASGWTREQHIKEYFNYERFKSRQGSEWSGFVEGTMEIDGVHYPIMRYSVKANGSQSDGFFMILFPDDLEKRHRFYVLMLAENHPEGQPAPGYPDLEFIVKNLEILPVLGSEAGPATTGIQKVKAGVFDDFDSGLLAGKDRFGIPIGFITFRDSESSVVIISTTSDHPQLPGEEDNNQVLQLDLDVNAWGGVLHRFENRAFNTWTPRDWRGFDAFSFWLYGNNTNTSLFIEILDNRKRRSTTPDAELYAYAFTDNFSGWKLIIVPFEELARKEIGNNAPNDGLGLSEVHGWAFGALNTGGPVTYYIDDLELLSVVAIELGYEPGDNTEAPLHFGNQPSTMAIARELAAAGKEHIIVWSSCPGEDTRSEHGVYVFYNNPVPLCYTYKISGDWAFIPELNGYQSKSGATFVGVIPSNAAEYDDQDGATLVQRVGNKIAQQYEAHYGLQLSGVELKPFESDRHGTWKWQAAAIRQDGRLILPTPKYIVESSPAAIFQITVEGAPDNEELVRQIIKSLKTTSAPDCYFPLLESTLKTMEDRQCVHRDGVD